ncbi:MAG: hypothetical protein RDV48_08685 [Candidatus Eremiobacteraeota bacterium]|nr:hypothetical protein [Candidatus Eremiobacteraeota bacterium]
MELSELYLDTIIQNMGLSAKDLQSLQDEQLRAAVSFAYKEVPFYRKKYDEHGVSPRDIRGLDDLEKLPVIMKGEMKSLPASEIIPYGSKPSDFRLLRTAGSTGEPLTIYRDHESIQRIVDLNMVVFYKWCQGKPYDSVLYIMTVSSTSLEKMLLYLFPVDEDRIVDVMLPTHVHYQYLEKYVPEYLSTYPSIVRNLSIELLRRNRSAEYVKLIHSTAELLDAHTIAMAKRAFPKARIVQTYGSHEGGLIAYQCPLEGNEHMHIAADSVHLELLEDETVKGSTGAVITDFTNFATPIIRYAGMGDLIKISSEPCPCGLPYPLITKLEGRIIDSIILPDGTGISPFTVTLILKEIRGIHKFQVIQNQRARLEIHVVPVYKDKKDLKTLEELIQAELKRTIAKDLEFHVHWVKEIRARKPGSHKVPVVICNIPPEEIIGGKKRRDHEPGTGGRP